MNDSSFVGVAFRGTVLLAAVLGGACHQEPSDFVPTIHGEWATEAADGTPERVVVAQEEITWHHGTSKQHTCPFRVMSFSEKARTIDISLLCRKRTGSEQPISHRLKLSEDHDSFVLSVEGRAIGVFRRTEG